MQDAEFFKRAKTELSPEAWDKVAAFGSTVCASKAHSALHITTVCFLCSGLFLVFRLWMCIKIDLGLGSLMKCEGVLRYALGLGMMIAFEKWP